jgi:beta-phosphoglucomutase
MSRYFWVRSSMSTGVLVDSPHEKAWRESLRGLMEGEWSDIRDRTTWSPEAFTTRVYEEQMSGKPRLAGARAAFEYFHIPDDEEEHRLLEYADRKQQMVVQLIEASDFTAYPDALRFIIAVKDGGLRVAAASSSKNADLFLRQIRLDTFAQDQGISSTSVHPPWGWRGSRGCRCGRSRLGGCRAGRGRWGAGP